MKTAIVERHSVGFWEIVGVVGGGAALVWGGTKLYRHVQETNAAAAAAKVKEQEAETKRLLAEKELQKARTGTELAKRAPEVIREANRAANDGVDRESRRAINRQAAITAAVTEYRTQQKRLMGEVGYEYHSAAVGCSNYYCDHGHDVNTADYDKAPLWFDRNRKIGDVLTSCESMFGTTDYFGPRVAVPPGVAFTFPGCINSDNCGRLNVSTEGCNRWRELYSRDLDPIAFYTIQVDAFMIAHPDASPAEIVRGIFNT